MCACVWVSVGVRICLFGIIIYCRSVVFNFALSLIHLGSLCPGHNWVLSFKTSTDRTQVSVFFCFLLFFFLSLWAWEELMAAWSVSCQPQGKKRAPPTHTAPYHWAPQIKSFPPSLCVMVYRLSVFSLTSVIEGGRFFLRRTKFVLKFLQGASEAAEC